jgi:hypothetical protein
MHTIARLSTAAAASLALAFGGAAAANASSDTIKDKRSDVVLNGKVSGDRTSAQRSAAYRRDVTTMKVSHGSKYVSVKIDLTNVERQAAPEGSGYYNAKIEIAQKSITNITGKVTPSFEIDQYVSYAPGQPVFYRDDDVQVCGVEAITDGDGPYTAESYIKNDVKFGKNGYIKVQIPRSCLSNESKIKVRATVLGSTSKNMYYDYISSSKSKTPAWTEWLLKG